MRLHGLQTDIEQLGDLAVRMPFGNQLQGGVKPSRHDVEFIQLLLESRPRRCLQPGKPEG